jgi:hypothetical protein
VIVFCLVQAAIDKRCKEVQSQLFDKYTYQTHGGGSGCQKVFQDLYGDEFNKTDASKVCVSALHHAFLVFFAMRLSWLFTAAWTPRLLIMCSRGFSNLFCARLVVRWSSGLGSLVRGLIRHLQIQHVPTG